MNKIKDFLASYAMSLIMLAAISIVFEIKVDGSFIKDFILVVISYSLAQSLIDTLTNKEGK